MRPALAATAIALVGFAFGGSAAAQAVQSAQSNAVPQQPSAAAEITRLIGEGRLEEALKRADAQLESNPRDAQVRFLRGVIFTDMKRSTDAMAVFEALTQEFPELPEPYNNLATLYAEQGQYELARRLLQRSIAAQPNYVTAHENLGDLYMAMAAQSYQNAARLAPNDTAVQAKLKLARETTERLQPPR